MIGSERAAIEGSTSLAVIWLGRMLRLLTKAIGEMLGSQKPLSECLLNGYNSCLGPHHPWLMRQTVNAAIGNASPDRETFLAQVGIDPSEEESSLKPFHEGISQVL